MNHIELTTELSVTPDHAFAALLDIEGQARRLSHMRGVEILARDDQEMTVRMDEHVDGEDVTITSRFVFESPRWLTYEHLGGPFGVNRGRFTLRPTASGVELSQRHETEQDLDARASLRDEWLSAMKEMHEAIGELANLRQSGE